MGGVVLINRELMFEDTDRKRPYDICFLSNNTIVIKFHDIVYNQLIYLKKNCTKKLSDYESRWTAD